MTGPLDEQVAMLLAFLGRQPFTTAIANLEAALAGADAGAALSAATELGMDEALLKAAVQTRHELGRLNDLIHATAIGLVLPQILEHGETVSGRPSLAAGNDPTRPYDLQTDQRIAEFKFSQWKGADAMRKRAAFQDLVHLAMGDRRRKAELYVVGDRPKRFLEHSKSKAEWGLDRAPALRAAFPEQFGDLAMSIANFRQEHAAHVDIIDLTTLLPVFAEVDV